MTNGKRPTCLLVLPWSPHKTGGVNEVIKSLVRHLRADPAFRPLLLISTDAQRTAEWDAVSTPTVYEELAAPYHPEFRLRSIVSFAAHLPFRLWRLRALVRQHNISAINTHFPTLGCLHFTILRSFGLYRGAIIHSFHGSDAKRAIQTRGLDRLLWRWLLRSADRLISPSVDLLTDIKAIGPVDEPQLGVINNGVDIDVFSAKPEVPEGMPSELAGRRIVLSIGGFEVRKGHETLLRAFVSVRQRHPDAALVILGAAFSHLGVIRQTVTDLGLERDVFLFPDLPHKLVPAYLSQAVLFALATRREGFPLALLEAGAARVPVISTFSPGVTELITDQVTGRLVAIDDADGFARNISDLLENPDEAARLAANLRAHVETNLTWRHHFERYRQLYTEQ